MNQAPSTDTRLRAIFCCLYFGIMPWQVYEKDHHYKGMSYWNHLVMNLEMAWQWIGQLDTITQEELDFEREVNPSWTTTFKTLFAGLK